VLPGVISSGVLDLIVSKTEMAGDLRIGLDLLKRSVLRAEHEERGAVLREDILLAYGNFRLLHLKKRVHELSRGEYCLFLLLMRQIAETGGEALISGELYGYLIEEEEIAYSIFMDRLENLADLGLIDLRVRQAKGRTDVIVPRYSREEVEGICKF
jgi:Cdc6-related protein, AAA superfamily ATPase